MEPTCAETCSGSSARRKGAFRNVVKRASARHNNAKLLEWIKMYHDTVVPLLPPTVALTLEAALRTVEYANSSTPLGQTDWGTLARGAYNWWTDQQKGGLVSPNLYGPAKSLLASLSPIASRSASTRGHEIHLSRLDQERRR